MRKPAAIPPPDRLPRDVREVLAPMRENLQALTGQHPAVTKPARLPSSATLGDLVNAYNCLVDFMCGPQ